MKNVFYIAAFLVCGIFPPSAALAGNCGVNSFGVNNCGVNSFGVVSVCGSNYALQSQPVIISSFGVRAIHPGFVNLNVGHIGHVNALNNVYGLQDVRNVQSIRNVRGIRNVNSPRRSVQRQTVRTRTVIR